jgi:hypothetical protein
MKDLPTDGRLDWLSLQNSNRSLNGLNDIEIAEFVHEAVCFAVRLWLFFDLESSQEVTGSGSGLQSKSLEQILQNIFRKDIGRQKIQPIQNSALHRDNETENSLNPPKQDRWSRLLTLRHLQELGGFRIHFVANLEDHLLLEETNDGKISICIFHHCIMLENFRQDDDIFPSGFLAETRQTLALLLPVFDESTKVWYAAQCEVAKLDEGR